ncbi:MAG: O-antigen polymerase, partial [Clostridiales bacterium]
MSILIILTIAVLSVLIGRHIFGKWFNHITVYVFMWTAMLVLYELKLMRYLDIKPLAWWGIAGAYFSFFLGSILVHVARSAVGNRTHQIDHHKRDLQIFSDDGKTINLIILVCSLIGLFAAIQHWVVLIKMFGSIPAVLVKVNLIYKMRVDGEIKGVLPYAFIFSYMGVFFSSLLIAYKNRLTLLSILPFIAVFLKEIANAGRGGMLYALFLFITTFFTYKQFIAKKERSNIKKSKASIIISAIVLIGLFIS